jgi:hypothetical protein
MQPCVFPAETGVAGGVKVGLGLSQRFRLFPEPVQAVEQLRM